MEKQIPKLQTRATMINDKVRMYLLPPLFNAAVRAGAAIMGVYKNRAITTSASKRTIRRSR